jgi:hypothetical protein
MKAQVISAALFLVMIGMASAFAHVRIHDDRGGQIGAYLARYHALRVSGERVEIDGTCASACTMLLGIIPRDRICVTSRATFAFHAAWDPAPEGHAASKAGTRILWSNYPPDVREWIVRHGGLQSRMIYLQGPELLEMFPICR